MAGHSRWANIKRKKDVNDKKRAGIFTKLSRNITIAVIEGGGITSPDSNIRLRLAIEKAKQQNMPKDNIERAIEKGNGNGRSSLQKVVYEAFGPHGSTFIIVSATDNNNRSIAEIRLLIERNGGKLASPGAVSYLFEKSGVVRFSKEQHDMESVLEIAATIGAIDILETDDEIEVYFPFEQLGKIEESNAEETYRPLSPVVLESETQEQEVLKILETLDDNDDVQQVFTNVDFHFL